MEDEGLYTLMQVFGSEEAAREYQSSIHSTYGYYYPQDLEIRTEPRTTKVRGVS